MYQSYYNCVPTHLTWKRTKNILYGGNYLKKIYLGLTEILDKPAYKQEKGDKRKDKSAKKTKHPLQ